jgi:Fic family protein
MAKYIYQYESWPNFNWDEKEIQVILGKVRHLQGKIFGQISTLGFSLKKETVLKDYLVGMPHFFQQDEVACIKLM